MSRNDWDTPIRELAIVPPGMPEAPRNPAVPVERVSRDYSGFIAWSIVFAFVALGLVAFFSALS